MASKYPSNSAERLKRVVERASTGSVALQEFLGKHLPRAVGDVPISTEDQLMDFRAMKDDPTAWAEKYTEEATKFGPLVATVRVLDYKDRMEKADMEKPNA